MPIRLTSHSADFAERFNAFLAMKREVSADIDAAASAAKAAFPAWRALDGEAPDFGIFKKHHQQEYQLM